MQSPSNTQDREAPMQNQPGQCMAQLMHMQPSMAPTVMPQGQHMMLPMMHQPMMVHGPMMQPMLVQGQPMQMQQGQHEQQPMQMQPLNPMMMQQGQSSQLQSMVPQGQHMQQIFQHPMLPQVQSLAPSISQWMPDQIQQQAPSFPPAPSIVETQGYVHAQVHELCWVMAL